MVLSLFQQLQKILDENDREPVHLFDESGKDGVVVMHEEYFRRVERLLAEDQFEIEWTGELADRRQSLLDLKLAQNLTEPERLELADLQRHAERHADKFAAPDVARANAIYQDLVNRVTK